MGAMLLSRGPQAEQNVNALVALTQRINDQNLLLSGQAGGNLTGPLFSPSRLPQQ